MRILLVSVNPFSEDLNNGKTYESMLSGFKSEDIAQLFFCLYYPDFNYCNNYFRITDIDILKSLKGCKQCGAPLKFYTKISPKIKRDIFFIQNLKPRTPAFFRDILWGTKRWKTDELKKWYREFAPDMVMFVGGPYAFMSDIAIYIANDLNVPLISFYTDDYLLHSVKPGLFHWFEKCRLSRIFKKAIKKSHLNLAIGDLMAKEYSEYFGRNFYPIMNSVPIRPYHDYPKRDKLVISYFGGLHLNRGEMIAKLARMVGDRAEVRVYSFAPTVEERYKFDSSGVIFCGRVSGEELWDKIYESDVLLHVESDDKYLRKLTRLSVSTKIPEYLMSGRPILGYGPTEVASMRLLKDNNVGVVLSSEADDNEVVEVIDKLLGEYQYRADIGKRGYDFCVNKFDNQKVVDDLMSKLENVVSDFKRIEKNI